MDPRVEVRLAKDAALRKIGLRPPNRVTEDYAGRSSIIQSVPRQGCFPAYDYGEEEDR